MTIEAIFIGEEPSPTAIKMQVTWADQRLAAKQLFDAFEANNFDPSNIEFDNLFKNNKVRKKILNQLKKEKRPIVAMGKKVQKVLEENGIAHTKMVHPAARGRIRKKERYAEHVGVVLSNLQLYT